MLGKTNAIPTLAVKDLAIARKFYEGTLGLKQADGGDEEVIVFQTGNATLNVYRSRYAGTNKATAVTWIVGDGIEEAVRALKGKGVAFEHYDIPGLTLRGDLHIAGDRKVAWFKDPDGNILTLISH